MRICIIVSCICFSQISFSSEKSTSILKNKYSVINKQGATLGRKLGIDLNPVHFKGTAATRFINKPTWTKYVSSQKAKNDYLDPADVYDPKPVTWNNWFSVTKEVEALALNQGALTIDKLKEWNKEALFNTLPEYIKRGEFKTTQNYGKNVDSMSSLSKSEVKNLKNFKFQGSDSIKLIWTELTCAERFPDQIQLPTANDDCKKIYDYALKYSKVLKYVKDEDAEFWHNTYVSMQSGYLKKEWYWYACWPRIDEKIYSKTRDCIMCEPSEVQLVDTKDLETIKNYDPHCGMIKYPEPQEVQSHIENIIKEITEYFNSTQHDEDAYHFALRLQREFVALHPFNKGNGRASRWIMDYITTRAGLPPLIIDDMDKDISTTLDDYVQSSTDGAKENLALMSTCLSKYESITSTKSKEYKDLQKTECGLLE